MSLDDLEALVFRKQRAKAVRKAVAALSPRARVVITARFGLDDGRPATLDETAVALAKFDGHTVPLSRERIRQIEGKALRYLARPAAGLHDVADLKKPAPKLSAVQFLAHQRALKTLREVNAREAAAFQVRYQQALAVEREVAEARYAAHQRALVARREAEEFAAQQRAQRLARESRAQQPTPGWPGRPLRTFTGGRGPTSHHYDWMQRIDDLEDWRAGGRPVNPFDWMKS